MTSPGATGPRFLDLVAGRARVNVQPAFPACPVFHLARVGVRYGDPFGHVRALLGAAGGLTIDDIRTRARAELVEAGCALMHFDEHRHVDAAAEDLDGTIVWTSLDAMDGRRLSWCAAIDVVDSGTAWVPSATAHLAWPQRDGAPNLFPRDSTGLAAHVEWERAVRHGLEEVLERDAIMLSWRVPGWPVVRLSEPSLPSGLADTCSYLGLVAHFFEAGDPALAPVVLVLLSKSNGEELTIGSACGQVVEESLLSRALSEALVLQWTARFSTEARHVLMSRGPWRNRPVSSLEHVMRAFGGGSSVFAWFQEQASRSHPAKTFAAGAQSLKGFASSVALALRCPIGVVPLVPEPWTQAGWYVARVAVPGAVPRDPEAVSLQHPRTAAALNRMASADIPLNAQPHPFG